MKRLNTFIFVLFLVCQSHSFAKNRTVEKAQQSLNDYFQGYIIEPDTQFIMFWRDRSVQDKQSESFPLSVDYRQNPSNRHCILELKDKKDFYREIRNPGLEIELLSLEKGVDSSLEELTEIQQRRYERSRRRGDKALVLQFKLSESSLFKTLECFETGMFATVFWSPRKNTVSKMLK